MPTAITPPPAFAPLKDSVLFTPLKMGNLELEHRVAQAPNTRMRGTKESDGVFVPNDLMAEYYGLRATKGGFQLTEATDICLYASGYNGVPGIFTESQIAGWKKVTDAIHAKGGYIFNQMWHVGRAAPPEWQGGKPPISSTNKPMEGTWATGTECASCPPRPMTVEEIHAMTKEFAEAAKRAMKAGFDGVEIHGANGYLLEQFLHDNINDRTDEYGGSVENRCRFLMEVVKSVTEAIGSDKVGLRLTPWNYYQTTHDSDRKGHWMYLCEQLAALPKEHKPIYVHMVEPRFDEVLDEEQKMVDLANKGTTKQVSLDYFRDALKAGDIKFISTGGFNRDNVVPKLESGTTDLVAFGRHFISNPDLVRKLKDGLPLTKYDRSTFYYTEPPEKGYLDYPVFE